MSDGTLQTLDVTMLDDVNNASGLVQLDSNAKIPACSGASITNLPGVTKSASDPVIATNPSGGVGSVWQNTTSGEMYVCTDATAGENVWKNVGAGTGDVAPYYYGGLTYGYTSGGTPQPGVNNIIDKFSFTTDGNATDVGDLTNSRRSSSNPGGNSGTYGYSAGGADSTQDTIDKFSTTSDGDATDVGNLTAARGDVSGSNSETHGYTCGGWGVSAQENIIDKYSFSSDGNATDVGNQTVARGLCGQ